MNPSFFICQLTYNTIDLSQLKMPTIISAQNITKSYGNVSVLQHLELSVDKGEMIAIMGKSGSGKSTLLHILGTLDKPSFGQLVISDTNPSRLSQNELAEFRNKEIGFVFQFHHLLPEFDLIENLCMPGFIAKMNANTMKKRAYELISYFGLEKQKNQKPSQLSGGEQQRAAICRALFNNPSIVLADEPTGNLDQQNAEEFYKIIHNLRQDFNQTFVIVTHQPELALGCDKMYLLENGKLWLK